MGYANAYTAVIRDAEKRGEGPQFVQKLVQYMKAKGHLSLLVEVVRKLEREQDASDAVVTVAGDADAKKFGQSIKDSLNLLGVTTKSIRTVHDSRAVGGYAVRTGSKQIDKTFRTALVSIYRRTTH